MNRVFLMGNLTRDPELRKTPSGIAVSDLGLAVSEKYRNKAGEMVETTCFADIVVWGKQAEACGQYLGKGAPVIVEGRLQLDQWQTDSGEKRSRLRVRADRVQFLGRPKKTENSEAAESGAAAGTGAEVAVAEDDGPADGGNDRESKFPF
jgi:single-strand DNA-binding protein